MQFLTYALLFLFLTGCATAQDYTPNSSETLVKISFLDFKNRDEWAKENLNKLERLTYNGNVKANILNIVGLSGKKVYKKPDLELIFSKRKPIYVPSGDYIVIGNCLPGQREEHLLLK